MSWPARRVLGKPLPFRHIMIFKAANSVGLQLADGVQTVVSPAERELVRHFSANGALHTSLG